MTECNSLIMSQLRERKASARDRTYPASYEVNILNSEEELQTLGTEASEWER